jgi:hypothetical protein
MSAMLMLMSQAANDPLARVVDQAAQQLQAEERRAQLGAASASDVTLRWRELARVRRAVAQRNSAAVHQVALLFEEETQAAQQQLNDEERRYGLGVATESDVSERKRDVLTLRRRAAEWKSGLLSLPSDDRTAARRLVKALLEEEITVAQRQLHVEERAQMAGALTLESVAKRQAEISDLQAASNSLPQR